MNLGAHRKLTREEEVKLAKKAQRGDTKARHELVTRNMRLVFVAARRFNGHGIQHDDLISTGSVGLLKAVDRFDHKRGVRFSTVAMHSIRSELYRHVIDNTMPIRMPSNERGRIFWRYSAVKFSLGPDATEDEILAALNEGQKTKTTKKHLAEILPLLAVGTFFSIDAIDLDSEHVTSVAPASPDSHPEEEVADSEQRALDGDLVARALAALTVRERSVILRRIMIDEPETLEEVGKRFGVSRERIRQIERRAMERLRAAVASIAEFDRAHPEVLAANRAADRASLPEWPD